MSSDALAIVPAAAVMSLGALAALPVSQVPGLRLDVPISSFSVEGR